MHTSLSSHATTIDNGRTPLWRKFALVAATIAVALTPIALNAAPASAAVIPGAITDVQIDGTAPSRAGDEFKLNATWAVPSNSQAGDTFSLSLPQAFAHWPTLSFEMRDSDGDHVGTCAIANAEITCTLSDFVERLDNVHGTLYFTGIAKQTTTADAVFRSGDVDFTVTLPAPIARVAVGMPPQPTELTKSGAPTGDGRFVFAITMPASIAVDGTTDTVFSDTYDSALTNPAAFSFRYWANGAWHRLSEGTGPNTYTLTMDPANSRFTFAFNDAGTYTHETPLQVRYTMAAAPGTPTLTSLRNTVEGNGQSTFAHVVFVQSAGGDGTGTLPPVVEPPVVEPPVVEPPVVEPPVVEPPVVEPPVVEPPVVEPPVVEPPVVEPPVELPLTPGVTVPVTPGSGTGTGTGLALTGGSIGAGVWALLAGFLGLGAVLTVWSVLGRRRAKKRTHE